MTDVALRIETAEKNFGGVAVLRGVDLEVRAGTCVAVLGPSGCGKTTLLRAVAGLESLDSGTITVAGRVVDDGRTTVPPEKRNVGLVFQELALWPHLDVRRNLLFVLEARGVPRGERQDAVEAALRDVGLPPRLLERRPGELSGGERQRVAVARALVQEPALLLLDEPLTGLDRDRRLHLIATLRRLRAERGLATLLVTHDQAEAFALADRVAVLREGRVAQCAPPETVYRRPVSREVASFVGAASLLRVTRDESGLVTPVGTFPVPADCASGPLVAVVRPEDVAVRPGTGSIPARVLDAFFQGDHWMLTVEVNGSEVLVRAATAPPDDGSLSLSVSDIVFVPAGETPAGPIGRPA